MNFNLVNDQLKLGKKLVVSSHVSDYDIVKRGLKERFFTRPWQPFKKTKSVYSPKVYLVNNDVVCSPQTERRIKEYIK